WDAEEREDVVQQAEARIEEEEPEERADRGGDRDRARHHRAEHVDAAQALVQQRREDEAEGDPDRHRIDGEEDRRNEAGPERRGGEELDVLVESRERRDRPGRARVVEAEVDRPAEREIGRASCREGVWMWGGA